MGESTTLHHHHHHHLHHLEEADEEALSLCDLPLDESNGNSFQELMTASNTRRSSTSTEASSGPEFFEFLSDLSSEMRAAEDIIFCGKLIPFNQQPPSVQPSRTALSQNDQMQSAFRRRSESLSELQSSAARCNSTKSKMLRNSRSLDYQKLQRLSSSRASSEADMERNPSIRSVGKSDKKAAAAKPRWYLFMFGMVKFPPEMDLRDIKNRQQRGNSSSMMFPTLDAKGNFPVNQSSGDKSSWKFLKALSCKDHASVAVTASFCMPQV